MKLRRRFAVAGMLCALLLCGQAKAQVGSVLDQVPGDAMVVIRIKNLDQVSRKVARAAKELGLDQMAPEFADPLGAIEEKSHLGKGVDRKGDLAMAVFDPGDKGGEPPVLVLVPVSDYAAFVSAFKDPKVKGEVTQASPPDGGETVYIVRRGSYAAVTPNKAVLGHKAGGLKIEGAVAKEFESKDALVYANMAVIRAKVLPMLKGKRGEIMQNVEQGLAGANNDLVKKFTPAIKVTVNQALNGAERVLEDTRGATLGFSLTDTGLVGTLLVDFEPGSYLAKMATGTKNSTESFTAGLPDRKYLIVGGGANNPEIARQVLGDMLDPISKELAAVPEGKGIVAAIEAVKKGAGSLNSQSFGWVAPAGALGTESIFQQVQVMRGDSAAFQSSQREIFHAMNDIMKMLPQTPGMTTSFEVRPGARTVDGVKLDELETKMNLDESNPQAAQAKQILSVMYGPNGMTGVSGAVDAKTLVTVQGGADQLVSDAIAAAKAGTDPLAANAGVKTVAAQLPKDRSMVVYINVGNIVNTTLRMAKQFIPVQVKLPADLPPIGVTAGSDGNAMRVDGVIPMDLVKGIFAAVMEARKAGGANGGL